MTLYENIGGRRFYCFIAQATCQELPFSAYRISQVKQMSLGEVASLDCEDTTKTDQTGSIVSFVSVLLIFHSL